MMVRAWVKLRVGLDMAGPFESEEKGLPGFCLPTRRPTSC